MHEASGSQLVDNNHNNTYGGTTSEDIQRAINKVQSIWKSIGMFLILFFFFHKLIHIDINFGFIHFVTIKL